jgi:hypothetical protein
MNKYSRQRNIEYTYLSTYTDLEEKQNTVYALALKLVLEIENICATL